MHPFPHDQIRLLIFDQLQPRAEIPDLRLDRRDVLVVSHVEHAVDVEAESVSRG
jgi:hypothetical protein